jgi:hypothetical protein
MRKDKSQPVSCVVCKKPIDASQRPSVRLDSGQEVHAECYNRWQELQRTRGH